MSRKKITKEEKDNIRERVKKEFPESKCLQDIHYIRYIIELEWQGMSSEEIDADIKEGAQRGREEMKKLKNR